MLNLGIATKINGLEKAISSTKKYEVVMSTTSTTDLQDLVLNSVKPIDLLIVSEKIDGRASVSNIILNIKKENPSIRIIYISSGDLVNEYYINQYYDLIKKGIYDIYYGKGLNLERLCNLIDNPKTKNDCQEIVDAKERLNDIQETQQEILEAEEIVSVNYEVKKDNVFLVTSVKPGTGKSFVSSNLACTLAKFAKTKINGERPRVLLVEGDLQTLSVSTLFGIKDDQFNLNAALNKLSMYMQSHTLNDWYSDDSNLTKQFINKCCLPVNTVDNLFIMEGHDFNFDEIYNIESSDYYYLIDYLSSQFDIVIVDANSSLQHKTTDPLFQLSKYIYLVMTTDFNNVKLNIKYRNDIEKLGVADKTKYILNKSLTGEQQKEFAQTFEFTDEEILNGKINIDYKIPLVDMSVIYNATFHHKPIATNLEFSTLLARIKFIEMASDIYQLENIDSVFKEIEELENFVGKKNVKKKFK